MNKLGLLLLGLLLLRGSGEEAKACCPVGRVDAAKIADQEVLIVWDAARKQEHFVRQAAFASKEKDFGFLVPTPTQPEIHAADSKVFDALRSHVYPPVETRWTVSPSLLCVSVFGPKLLSSGSANRRLAVRVLSQQEVAGYEVTVLKADDADALSSWLERYGYPMTPVVNEWIRPYVKKGWIVTAFKYAANRAETGTEAVRLSFATDKPLFPYRIPKGQDSIGLLRLYVVGLGPMIGELPKGTDGYFTGLPVFSDSFQDAKTMLEGVVPAEAFSDSPWLTLFEDERWRPDMAVDDIYFSPSPFSEPFRPNRIKTNSIPLPLDLLLVLGWAIYRWRRARSRSEAPKSNKAR